MPCPSMPEEPPKQDFQLSPSEEALTIKMLCRVLTEIKSSSINSPKKNIETFFEVMGKQVADANLTLAEEINLEIQIAQLVRKFLCDD